MAWDTDIVRDWCSVYFYEKIRNGGRRTDRGVYTKAPLLDEPLMTPTICRPCALTLIKAKKRYKYRRFTHLRSMNRLRLTV